MGMAASQARYLELTARKTNVEYEGQQINQQRTSLANESAGLFSRLLSLNVPTAPSSSDYTSTQYSFSDGTNNCTISEIKTKTGDPNNNATVTYYYNSTQYTGIAKTRTDLGVTGSGTTDDPYWLTDGTGTKKTKLSQCATSSTSDTDYETDKKALLQICKDNADSTLRDTLDYDPDNQTISDDLTGAYKYTASDGTTYYYSSTDLDKAEQKGGATALSAYYAADLDKKVYTTADAYLTKEDSGRYSEIKLDGTSTSFDVSTATTTNETAYNDAMNEYSYQKDLYDKQVADINAKTEVIQQEDRTLELKLRQLDTEQEALQTEMESVKKVIDKNIESTFKTFQ